MRVDNFNETMREIGLAEVDTDEGEASEAKRKKKAARSQTVEISETGKPHLSAATLARLRGLTFDGEETDGGLASFNQTMREVGLATV